MSQQLAWLLFSLSVWLNSVEMAVTYNNKLEYILYWESMFLQFWNNSEICIHKIQKQSS